MSTVVVTGAAGFIGSHVVSAFASQGHRVVGVDRTDASPSPTANSSVAVHHQIRFPSQDLVRVLGEERPDTLVHCAGSASVPASFDAVEDDFTSTVGITFHVLDALRNAAPRCHLIYPSSAAVYGNPVALPVREDATLTPISPYGFHKRQAEVLCAEFSALYGIPSTVLRIFSAYGPGLQRQVVWDICRMAVETGRVRLEGTGDETRDFIHVTDIANAVVSLSSNWRGHRILNLADGVETSIAAVADGIVEALGITASVEASGVASEGKPTHWRANIDALRATGFEPAIRFPDGIAGTVAWARDVLREEHRADLP